MHVQCVHRKTWKEIHKTISIDSFCMSTCYIHHLKISTINIFPLGENGYSVPTLVPSLVMVLFKSFVQTFEYPGVSSLSS